MVTTTHQSFCRVCLNSCPTLVDVEDGRLVRVRGDPVNPIFDGYTCVKGRAQPAFHDHPERLLHSLKRVADGSYAPISTGDAMDEVAERIQSLVTRHGNRAVASYFGTAILGNCTSEPMLRSFMTALGSPMYFSPNTIDKPGKQLAAALHGTWMAPLQAYDQPDVALLIGANPFKSYYGVACGHPSKWLNERLAAGMRLIVIDPRRSDIAKRASLHLQPAPGHDTAILASMLRFILTEELYDQAFIRDNADGVDALAEAVAPFTASLVAQRADIRESDLEDAARIFATAARGYAVCGVGPGFSGSTTLIEYLVLNLETLCGRYLRAGERVTRMPTLLPAVEYRAQAAPPRPAWGFGEPMMVTGLTETAAGMPTAALVDEILEPGPHRVRALISLGGNPVGAWPDQARVVDAMNSLELLVQFDPWMSSTSRLAHYVIAPRMSYEVPGTTLAVDAVIAMPTWYGPHEAYSHYTPALVEPPAGADVLAEWEFLYGVAQRLDLQLALPSYGGAHTANPGERLVDMTHQPSSDELLDLLVRRSRVPLEVVKQHRSGSTFLEPTTYVQPKEPGWSGRFDLANGYMLNDLSEVLAGGPRDLDGSGYPLRLICQRLQHTINSCMNDVSTNRGRGYNPAFMHPEDLEAFGLKGGDPVRISSARGSIPAIVHADATLRPGLVAMAHGFGGTPDRDGEFESIGSPVGRLCDAADVVDRYTAMPRMSDIPISLTRLMHLEAEGDVRDRV
ncbi:MAG: molybdopterin-dependent oxidoreductase [Ilumatobacteraceae bacterium]